MVNGHRPGPRRVWNRNRINLSEVAGSRLYHLGTQYPNGQERSSRNRAGYRAYWVSAALAYAVLMWLSFSASGSVPTLSPNSMWYAMAGVVVMPMAVYIASIVNDDARL